MSSTYFASSLHAISCPEIATAGFSCPSITFCLSAVNTSETGIGVGFAPSGRQIARWMVFSIVSMTMSRPKSFGSMPKMEMIGNRTGARFRITGANRCRRSSLVMGFRSRLLLL